MTALSATKMAETNMADTAQSDITNGVRVLRAEAEGLMALAESLDQAFVDAVSAIDDMKGSRQGRLIVAGIGKSGHVARKIAATLASTGTPAYYVHPGEASHGDLGMVTDDDVVLLLSNSGENNELSDLIHYTRRFGIKLIAITSNPGSTLGSHADIVIQMPKVAEACPNGLAPTTSSTMMLALGDALAVALLQRTGLTAEQFKRFHPGGKLGQKLLKVTELMHRGDDLPLVSPDTLMGDALIVLTGKNLGCVLIADPSEQDKLLGIITDGDLKRHMGPDLLSKSVSDIMTVSPKSIGEKALAVEALNMMTKTPGHYLTSLVVTNEAGRLAGLIRLQDCLQAGVS